MATLALKFLVAHLLGDFVFQSDKWVADKQRRKQRSRYLYLHIAVHGIILMVLLGFDVAYWKGMVIVLASHFIIDLVKLHLQGRWNARVLFTADQLLHLLVIAGVAYAYEPFVLSIGALLRPGVLLLAAAIIMVSSVSAIVMRLIMSNWKFDEQVAGDSLEHAGKYIGIIERLFVFAFIALNQWSAIGFLITAKSVFRFSDLSRAKDRKLTEYILIGTLLSFGIAIVVGLVYRYVRTTIGV